MNKKPGTNWNIDDITTVNQTTYNNLSNEYESRTNKLFEITEHVINLFKKYLRPNGEILETGCAVGLAMNIMSEKGFSVTGIDLSPKMVKFAKMRNPKSIVIKGDFLKYRFKQQYDGIFSFAFIHLFPKEVAMKVLEKMFSLLKPGGILYLGTSKSSKSYEGWEIKKDYALKFSRYRKHWTEFELRSALQKVGFKILKRYILIDPYKKVWMDFVVQK